MNGDEDVSTELAREVAQQAVKEIEKDRSFAWELIANARRDSKRWFIALIVVVALWFSTIGIFVFYLYQYDFSSTTEITVDGKDGTALYQDGEGNVINNGDGYQDGDET